MELEVYYNGNNVCLTELGGPETHWEFFKGVGLGFSMTLFQYLAHSSGFDPSKGPGNPCDFNDSGNCVIPWGSGTKTVSSIVLIANGVSFAVSICSSSLANAFQFTLGDDIDIYYHRLSSGLWYLWKMAPSCCYCPLLDFSVRRNFSDKYVHFSRTILCSIISCRKLPHGGPSRWHHL